MNVESMVKIFGWMAAIAIGTVGIDRYIDSKIDMGVTRAEIFALGIAIADLTGTIGRYDALEAVGRLSEENRVRRESLIRLREEYLQMARDRER